MRRRSRPNSFAEWIVGRNCLPRYKPEPEPAPAPAPEPAPEPEPVPERRPRRRIASVQWETDDESEEDTVSITVPRAGSSQRRKKSVRFGDDLRSALKQPTERFPEPAAEPEPAPAPPAAETAASTDEEHEMDSDCSCDLCSACRDSHIIKEVTEKHAMFRAEKARKAAAQVKAAILAKEAAQAKAATQAKVATQAKQAAKANNKNKGNQKKQVVEESSEDAETETTEAEPETEPESEEAASEEPAKKGKGGKNNNKQQKNAPKNGANAEAAAKANKKGGKKGAQAKANANAAVESQPGPAKVPTPPPAEVVTQKTRRSKSKDRKLEKKKPKVFAHQPSSDLRRPNLVLPIQSKVSHVEHVVETGSDPEPNAFHDSRNGILRHYSGAAYGNPHGQLYPRRSYSNNPPIGAPHPLNNPWYHGFSPNQQGSGPQQGPGPQQPQWQQQGPGPQHSQWQQQGPGPQQSQYPQQPPQQPPMNTAPPNNGAAPWFQGYGTAVVGGGDKGGVASPENDSPSVRAVRRKDKKNVAFSGSTGYCDPSTLSCSGEKAMWRASKRHGYEKDSNTLWAGTNPKSHRSHNGHKSTDSRQRDTGRGGGANYKGETVDSFLERLKSNSSKHESPQPRLGNFAAGSVRHSPHPSYTGWNGQDNGFGGPPAAATANGFGGSNNGGMNGNGNGAWGGEQNDNNNNNAGFGSGSQGWGNNISPAPNNSNGNDAWNQDFNTGANGQRNSVAGSNNQQQQTGWGGSNRSDSKKNEGPMQFGNDGFNQPNGTNMSPVQGSQGSRGSNNNNSNANQGGWGNENTSNGNGDAWGNTTNNGGGGHSWGNGSHHGGGGSQTNWTNTNGNFGKQEPAWGAYTGGRAPRVGGGDANDDNRWEASPAGLENNVIAANGGHQSSGSTGSTKSGHRSHKSHHGSKHSSKSWKQGDDNVGPSSHNSGDIPGAWPSAGQERPLQGQSSSPPVGGGGNVMGDDANTADNFGNNFGGGGGMTDWHDPSAAQGTSYWEQEGQGTENVVQQVPDNGNTDALQKAGGSSWW